jgi:uncharacterized protein YneF (UPF0154 family)
MSKVQEMLQDKTELIQRRYSKYAQKGNLWEINELLNQTKIAPQFSDQELSVLYVSSAKKETYRAVDYIKQLQKLERGIHKGKTPVFNDLDRKELETALQEGYGKTIVEDWKIEKQDFDELHNLTGIPVSRKTVQKAIDHRFKSKNILGDGGYFRTIKAATGMDLKPTPNLVQKVYKDCLIKEPLTGQSLYFWEYIAKSTGIKPNEKLAQSAYRYFLGKKDTFSLMRFVEFLGIKPEEEIVQKTYINLSNYNGEEFKKLEELTGIKPSEEIVHHTYSEIVKRKDFIWDSHFKSLFQQTGIMPSEELVQESYKVCIQKGNLNDFNELYEAFKIEPSSEVKKTLESYLTK